MRFFWLVSVACCLLPFAQAWWDHGHMLIPMMVKLRAESGKNKVKPDDIKNVERLARVWAAMSGIPSRWLYTTQFPWLAVIPDYMKMAKTPAAVGLARSYADGFWDNLHFFNRPIIPGTPDDPSIGSWGDESILAGVPGALFNIYKNLITAYQKGHTKLENRFTVNSWMEQFSLFLHFMGDVHQPLHIGGLKSSCFPEPPYDQGGNKILIEPASTHNLSKILYPLVVKGGDPVGLHQYWDSGLWQDAVGLHAPRVRRCIDYCSTYSLNPDANQLVTDAEAIMKEFPPESFGNLLSDFAAKDFGTEIDTETVPFVRQFAQESYEFATNTSYVGLVPDNYEKADCSTLLKYDPTDEYLKNAHQVIKQRLALAAYRLEVLLPYVFDIFPYDDMIAGMNKQLKAKSTFKDLLLNLISLVSYSD